MKKYTLLVSMVLIFLLLCTTQARSELDVSLRGALSSLFVLRDTNGFQHGLMDELYGTQWRNELQFDLTVRPVYKTLPSVRLEKVFLSYKGAYDAIYDLRDHAFEDIQKHKSEDFELGRRDIETENDLREAFVDFVAAEGMHKANLRLGRQIVRWGESDAFNVINVVNPSDNSYQMFFSDPDDTATPLWMARLDYSVMGAGFLDTFGIELLAIPDIRPMLTAPLNGETCANFDAPYAFLYRGYGDPLGGAFLPYMDTTVNHINEDVPGNGTENMEYAVSTSFGIGGFEGVLHYFAGHQDMGAVDFSDYWTYWMPVLGGFGYPGMIGGKNELTFRHPMQRVYGYSFNYFVAPLNGVIRGEGAYTNKMSLFEVDPTFTDTTWIAKKNVIHNVLAFDKDLHPSWIGTDSALTWNTEGHWKHIKGWDTDKAIHPANKEDTFILTTLLMTDYYHGTIKPTILGMYDTEGTWCTRANIKWDPDGKWLYEITEMSWWGNPNCISDFAPLINTSELSFKVSYRF